MAGPNDGQRGASPPKRRRFLWFIGLYVVSLAAFVSVVYLLRALVPF